MKRQRPLRLRRSRLGICGQVFIIMASLLLCSCAMVDTATQKMGIADIGDKPETFYVGMPDLKLFPEPRFPRATLFSPDERR